ncbi:hypothetical protein ACN42_g2748 [Penicillium freii]|uniref:Uncharacterized protein n=1 Tax=Penicillium freii TaxID=48697 RepID=A0A101MPK4_PENFR|nr:hypothetical protein ACN42_g2748 [Penicillium freii]
MSLIDNQSQREPELGTGGPVERTVSPCVWDPLSALCIGTVCWRVCRSSAVWLSGPVIALVGSCLYFPLTFPVPLYPPLLPLPTVYVSTLTQVPRSAVERLNTPTLGGNFELPNYFTSPIILLLSPTSLPQCGCGVSCLSTIAYLYSIGYLRLIQLSPTCEINSPNGCPSLKHTKSLALALLV